jgi:Ca2+/Na+ antiporter
LNLIFGGVVYAIWSMVTSSTTGLFKSRFGLSELVLGLAFLPNGTSPSYPALSGSTPS